MNAPGANRNIIMNFLLAVGMFLRKTAKASHELDALQEQMNQAAAAASMLFPPNYEDVVAFHDKFGVGPNTEIPHLPPEDVWAFRKKFFEEELYEMDEAYRNGDLVKFFDAHLDLAYITFGSAHLASLPWQLGWELVQKANMDKQRAKSAAESQEATGRGHSLDVIKPKGWMPPEPALALLVSMKQRGYRGDDIRTHLDAVQVGTGRREL